MDYEYYNRIEKKHLNSDPDEDINDDEYASEEEIEYINDIMFPNDDYEDNQTFDSIFGDD